MTFRSAPLLLPLLLAAVSVRADDLRVLEREPDAQQPVTMLRDYLREKVHAALDRRLERFEQLETEKQIATYQKRLRTKFRESLGGFPERTPLKPRVVGTFTGDGYRAEKIIYQSRPGCYVTAVLYLPETEPPYPGVLLPCGHSENGKAAGAYQRASILLARQGLAVLCYDPVGQGERKQILATDEHGQPLPEGRFRATTEHTLAGVAPILLGQNLATYRIWDGMRSLDYLCSRDDIDASRIGCTGNSGGGLMTSYLMALDDRIDAAAPGCFITTTRLKNDSPGPGDAEQNIFGQIHYGMDHPDYILMRAPRPTLICAATHDFVPIAGAWKAFRQAKRLYTRLGFAERVDLIEADRQHGFTRPLRVGVLRWMRRWLLDRDDAPTESEFDIHSEADLQCTPRGQVLLLDGARPVFDLYRDEEKRLVQQRERLQDELSKAELVAKVRQTAAIRPLDELPPPDVERAGTISRDGCTIEKLILRPEKEIVLPALHFVPDEPEGPAVLYLHGDGKDTDAMPRGPIDELVNERHPVLAVDLRGYGETETTPWRFNAEYFGSNAAEYFIACMLGRSLVGMRAEDVLTSARYLKSGSDQTQGVQLVAVGRAGIPALHAAAIEPRLFASIRLRGCLDSWTRVVETPVAVDQLENTVHGALRVYDLPDLMRLAGRKKVEIRDPRDARGRLLRDADDSR